MNTRYKSAISFMVIFHFWVNLSIAQNSEIDLLSKIRFEKFEIKGSPNIEFMITKDTTGKRKPLILFIQGSGHVPLVLFDSKSIYNGFPFKIDSFRPFCNFAIISKPGIPLSCPFESGINGFRDEKGKIPDTFFMNDHLEYYTRSAESVITFLLKKKYVNPDSIFVVGHSQGYRVAAKLAAKSKTVKKVVCMSANPISRYSEYISEQRFFANCGIKSNEVAQNAIDSIRDNCLNFCHNFKTIDTITSVPIQFRNMFSFNFDIPLINFLNTSIPILIIFGTKDIGAQNNDILPILFAASGKQNLELKAFPDLNHNFFKKIYTNNGDLLKEEFHWDRVFKSLFQWLVDH
jgi:dienelactone hydrolase